MLHSTFSRRVSAGFPTRLSVWYHRRESVGFSARVLIGLLAAFILGTSQVFAADREEFRPEDFKVEYVVPEGAFTPEMSHIEITILYAHAEKPGDNSLDCFFYKPGDKEYTGCYLYMSIEDGKGGYEMEDQCFLWFGTQGRKPTDFAVDSTNFAKLTNITKKGWKMDPVTIVTCIAPKVPSVHKCKKDHYCYMKIVLYPPADANRKNIIIKMDGGTKKNYSNNGNCWTWLHSGAHWNQQDRSWWRFNFDYPYTFPKLSMTDVKVNTSNQFVASYDLAEGDNNTMNIAEAKFTQINTTDTVKIPSGGLFGYRSTQALKDIVIGEKVVRKYDGKAQTTTSTLSLPAFYNCAKTEELKFTYKGFPYANVKNADFTMEDRTVSVRWDIVGSEVMNETYVKNGNWYVLRKDTKTGEVTVASLPLDLTTTQFTDHGIDYNAQYAYYVVYRQSDWYDTFDNVLLKGVEHAVVETPTNSNLKVTAEGLADRVNINAKWNSSSKDDFYTLHFYRNGYEMSSATSMKANVGTYTFSDVRTDQNPLYQRVSNTYKVVLTHIDDITKEEIVFDEKTVDGNISGGSVIRGLTASRGTYTNKVNLTWRADRNSQDTDAETYIIERRTLGKATNSDFKEVRRVSDASSYITCDDDVAPGEYYEYRVSVMGTDSQGKETKYNGITTVGFALATGTISGSIRLKDNTAQAGLKVNVEAVGENNTTCPEVTLHSLHFEGAKNPDRTEMLTLNMDSTDYQKWLDGNFTMQFWYKAKKGTGTEYLLALPGTHLSLRVDKQSGNHSLQMLNESSVAGSINISALSGNENPWVHVTVLKTNTSTPSSLYGSRDVLYKVKTAYLDANGVLQSDNLFMTANESYIYLGYTKTADRTNWKIQAMDATSEYPITNAIDGNGWTWYESAHYTDEDEKHGFMVDLGQTCYVNGFSYERHSYDSHRCEPQNYDLYTFNELPADWNSKEVWSKILSGNYTPVINNGAFADWNGEIQTFHFNPVKARYVVYISRWVNIMDWYQGMVNPSYLVCGEFNVSNFIGIPYHRPLLGTSLVSGSASFIGEMDEFRMYTRALSDEEITKTRFYRLSGQEKDLYCYLPMDEGINEYVFDHASASGNQRSASFGTTVYPTSSIPTGFKANSGLTDSQGFYSFSGLEIKNNITYRIEPDKSEVGRDYTPSEIYCTLAPNSSNKVDQDFVDLSSVSVSGIARYRYGTYPVEGALVKVDGNAVQRDGKYVRTDSNGEFNIDVPVGKHYITLSLDGHGFLDAGRFPKEGTYTFKRDTSGIAFTDSTLVLVRGRVSGGPGQAALAMGVGIEGGSRALIGQATLRLAPVSNLNYRLNASESDTVTIDVIHDPLVKEDKVACASTEIWLPYEANPLIKGQVEIKTDPTSGEFRALLPPMTFQVTYGMTKSVNNDELNTKSLSEFNMTPGKTSTLNVRYDTEPTFQILDIAHNDTVTGKNDGLFGEDSLMVDALDSKGQIRYTVIDRSNKDNPKYAAGLGCPLFQSGKQYDLSIHAVQRFYNMDSGKRDSLDVPLSDELVSFRYSQWGEGLTDTVRLNKEGYGTYTFIAAQPNTDEVPNFSLQGSCELSGRTYPVPHEPISALFTGFMPYDGKQTLVEGPDIPDFILRDPPGGNSYSTLQKGASISTSVRTTSVSGEGKNYKTYVSGGADVDHDWIKFHSWGSYSHDWSRVTTKGEGNGETSTITLDDAISTGSDAYHVGANGDVYIGHSSYLTYGTGWWYGPTETKDTPAEGTYNLTSTDGKHKAVFGGQEYEGCSVGKMSTGFAVAQRYIVEELIPQWERVKASTTNADTIRMAENSIMNWKNIIYMNEQQKLKAFEADADTAIAYSAGQALTYTKSMTTKSSVNYSVDASTDFNWMIGPGGKISVMIYVNSGWRGGKTKNTSKTTTTDVDEQQTKKISYTLSDADSKDNFLITVYDPYKTSKEDNWVPSLIFRREAGASTNPWEGADSTLYYLPGKVLSTATQKVEKCSFRILNPNLADIPNGREATVQLELTNGSEVGKAQTFYLYPADDTNADGLVMTIDGAALTTAGLPFYIPANSTITKTMKVRQTRYDVLAYENVKLNMGGQHVLPFEYSNPELYPGRMFSIHFVPSSSPVTFSVRNTAQKAITTVNLSSGTSILLRATDYDTDFEGFYKMRMQYKADAETQWHTLPREWSRDELVNQSQTDYIWDMKEMADGKYQFRAETMSQYGTGNISFYSDTITIVKDMKAPELIGKPSPENGILGCEDQIRYTFNESIFSGAVTKANVSVTMLKGSITPDDTKLPDGEAVTYELTTSDNAILITPTTSKSLLEGNTLRVKITDIEDMNGNKMATTVTSHIYVHQCPFTWINDEEDVLTLYNMSSGIRHWSLEDVPSWLTLKNYSTGLDASTSGTIGGESYLTFRVAYRDDLPVGEYTGTLRVVDEEGLGVDLEMRHVQFTETPYWAVRNPNSPYNSTLTAMMTKEKKKDEPVTAYALIGAFYKDSICVGATYPQYVDNTDTTVNYRVMMNIYTDDTQKGDTLSFKLYDAMHDVIYTNLLVSDERGDYTKVNVPLDHITSWGTISAPWSLDITDKQEHNYDLGKGWNWVSFNMDIDKDMRKPKLFLKPYDPIGNLEIVKSQTSFSKCGDQTFNGDVEASAFNPGSMLMVKTTKSYEVPIKGLQIDPAQKTITLHAKNAKGPSYNWIGYTPLSGTTVEEAFSGLTKAEGDVIKSQTDFAYYTHGMWVGTLQYIYPLEGYIYSSNADAARTFVFKEPQNYGQLATARSSYAGSAFSAENGRLLARRTLSSLGETEWASPWIWDPTQWSMNMTAIATVKLNLEDVSVGYVGIFDNEGNCRCVKSITDDGHVYLTISGDDRCDLRMKLQTEDGSIYEQQCPFSFTANDSQGTYTEPVVLYFGEQPTGVNTLPTNPEGEERIYNLAGQRVNGTAHKGVYIQNNEKIMK